MPAFTSRELRRERLQRAIYSRFNSHPQTVNRFQYSDAWMIAGHAVAAVFEVEEADSRDGGPAAAPPGAGPANEGSGSGP